MKCLVPVKRVVDYQARIQIKPDHSGVETENVKMALNPFDEIALEQALQLKEANQVSEIISLSIGEPVVTETLRTALARGADSAYLIETDQSCVPLDIAQILKQFLQDHPVDLILLGKQSIDGDNNQTGQMLAALLDWPQATFASKMVLENNQLEVTREVDGGLEVLRLDLPAVVTTDLRLNQPRYITLPNVMQSKQKPLHTLRLGDMNITLKPHVKILKVTPPPERKPGILVDSVAQLVDKLKNEAKVI